MTQFTVVQLIIIWLLPVLFAITVHEVAHGWVALKLGDKTAQQLGRLTLNPIKHIDLVGTVIIPIILLTLGGFIFGWAKPVPVEFRNLRKPRIGAALVAAAGPLANFGMAILWAAIAKLGIILNTMGVAMIYMGKAGIIINAMLMIINLIPIPPLDGSRIVASLLPASIAIQFNKLENYGFLILVILLATGLLGKIVAGPIYSLQAIITTLFNL